MKVLAAMLVLCIAALAAGDPILCPCTNAYVPVCGTDGTTYANQCAANCAYVELLHEGPCDIPCICTLIFLPVCGNDGQTYVNECSMLCKNVEKASDGECVAVTTTVTTP